MKAEELASKFAAYMLAEINYDIKQGIIHSSFELESRFRDVYKAWKKVFLEPEKYVTLFAAEVEKIYPKMKNNWR